MKRLLLLSLLLNAVLVGVAWRQAGRQPPLPRSPRAEVGEPAARRGARIAPVRPGDGAPATPWAGIESDDLRQLMANLRAIGCPEPTIRDIVVFRVCRSYRARLLAAEAAADQSWDYTRNQGHAEWSERNARRRDLRDEMDAELDALLGRSFGSHGVGATMLGFADPQATDFLPIAKRKALRELESRYRRLSDGLTTDRSLGLLDAEGAARLVELRRQQQAELTQLLSPEEAEEYLYRESPAAQYVRRRLPSAKSEAEFRRIVKVAAELGMDPDAGNDFASRFGQEPADPELARAEAGREAAFQQRLEEVLGKERRAEQETEREAEAERARLQEQQRHEEQERARFVELAGTMGVEPAAAERFLERLKELQPTLEPRLAELEQSLPGTPDEKRQQMEAVLRAELEQQATDILGDKGREFIEKLMRERP